MYFEVHAVPKKLSIFFYSELQCEARFLHCWLMLWSVICKIITWAKMNFYVIRWYSFMYVASENVCIIPNPSTIWAILYVICLVLFMFSANLLVTCSVLYDVRSVLYAMCPDPFCYVVLLLCPFACFNSFITWAKIAHCVSIFVASRLLCCIAISMHYAQNYMLYEQIHLLTFGDNYYWVIFRHVIQPSYSTLHEIRTLCIKLNMKHKILHVTPKFAHSINEIKHMT